MDFAFVGTSTETEWGKWDGFNFEVDDTGTVQLEKESLPTYVTPTQIMGSLPQKFTVVDIDLDAYGTLYVLSASGDLFRYDRERDRMQHLPYRRPDEEKYGDPTALHVTHDLLYVAYSRKDRSIESERDPGSIHAVNLKRYRTRWHKLTKLNEQPFDHPSRIVEAWCTRTVYALYERTGGGEQSGVVVTLDADGTKTVTAVIEELERPQDIAVDRTGALYVLAYDTSEDEDEPVPVVWRFEAEELRQSENPLSPNSDHEFLSDLIDEDGEPIDDPASIEIVDPEELLVGVGPDTSTEAVLFRYLWRETDESEPKFDVDRVASLRWSCHRLLLARGRTRGRLTGLYIINSGQQRIHFLSETPQNGRNERIGKDDQQSQTDYTAQLHNRFDSGLAETHWHRVKLGIGQLGLSNQVRLSYYATDEPVPIGSVKEINGIGSIYGGRLRDENVENISELIQLDPETIADITTASVSETQKWSNRAWMRFEDWWQENSQTVSKLNPRDALLDAAIGRYIWIRLELTGSEFTSPQIEAFRMYFPKQSYLRYLPAVYREDQKSAVFLEQFLSMFESIFVDVEETLDNMTRLLDASGTPASYLSWLQRWIAVETDETWSETATREFLSNAPELFKARGTRSGLVELLRIYLEVDDSSLPSRTSKALPSTQSGVNRAIADDLAERSSTSSVHTPEGGPYLLEYIDLDCIDNKETRAAYERFIDCQQCFISLVGPFIEEERMRTIQRLIDAERPAHTTGRAVALRPMIQLGSHTYLGINTILSREEFVLGRTRFGEGSVLSERNAEFRRSNR